MLDSRGSVNRILVTGGAGFIGGALVRRMSRCEDIDALVVLDALTYAASEEAIADAVSSGKVSMHRGDIGDSALVRSLLYEEEVEAVVHLAAETHVDRSIDDPAPFVATNVVGTCRLLEAVRRYWASLPASRRDRFRFVHVSTDEVFGELGREGKFHVHSPYAPRSPYAASKAAADHFVRAYHYTYGLPVVVTHSGNNFGPYQFPEKLVPLAILNAWEGKPIPVYGRGEQVRDWLHVDDHCAGIELAVRRGKPGETYLFGGQGECSNLEIVQRICDLVDRLRPDKPSSPSRRWIQFVADRPGHDFRYAIDSQKAREELGWKTEGTWEEKLAETVTWYISHPAWVAEINRRFDRRRLGLPKDMAGGEE